MNGPSRPFFANNRFPGPRASWAWFPDAAIALPATALCILTAITRAPSANAATSIWEGADACVIPGVPVEFCSMEGDFGLWVGTASTPCTMSGASYVSCSPFVVCAAAFHSDVPYDYEASCTGFGSESCSGTGQAGFTGCPGSTQPWGSYLAAVPAGSCTVYTLEMALTPQVPLIAPAELSHSITLCVNSATGPFLF